jgi:7-carboxy-7-deazaguanine synthase
MRLNELYTSVQGEGPGVGHMTQFIRFGGCNLRCSGWPCDTQHAIDPALYRHEWIPHTVEEIMARVQPYPKRVTLTGGEPFLQPMSEMVALVKTLHNHGYSIEVFTNGTILWPHYDSLVPNIQYIMDWKLAGSGEDYLNKNRFENMKRLSAVDAVKFVIKDEEDFKLAVSLWETYLHRKSHAQVYYGAVWGAVEDKQLVAWAERECLDWKLNVQMHNYIFNRDDRGI